jgi:Rhs element Vgr protein
VVAAPVVTANGDELPAEFELISAEIQREANRIPFARLVFEGGDLANNSFPVLDSDAMKPGAVIELKVQDGDTVTPLFKGLVHRLNMEIAAGVPRLLVDCRDKAFKLTKPRRTLIYPEGTDSDAIGAILSRTSVEAGDLGPAGPSQPALVQYDASDWDFIVSRADANGLAVVLHDNALSLVKPDPSGSPALNVQLGIDDIDEVELELDASDQLPDISATGWDLPQSAVTDAAAAAPQALAQGNVDPADAGTALGFDEATLPHMVPAPPAELKAWASARLARSRLAMLRGRLALGGTDLAPMDLIGLQGFGARFDGTALVSAVRHLIEDGSWRTDVRLGMPAEGFATSAPDIVSPPSQGLLPAARGLHIGLVGAYEEDSDGEYRVRVRIPGVTSDSDMLWARLATPEGGNDRGFFFRPNEGDEVIVGFLGEDPRQPVVLGALFGSKNKPPTDVADLSEDNVAKGIITKSGIQLLMTDQDKPVVTLKTKAASLTLDDDGEQIVLKDGNSSITFASAGLTLKTSGDFTIEASGAVKIKGASIDAN